MSKLSQATARATLRRAAAEAVGRGAKLRLDQQTAALVLRATGAADFDPETLIGLWCPTWSRPPWLPC